MNLLKIACGDVCMDVKQKINYFKRCDAQKHTSVTPHFYRYRYIHRISNCASIY